MAIAEILFHATVDSVRYKNREWDQHEIVLLDDGRIRIGDASDDYSFVNTSKPIIFQDGYVDDEGDWHSEFVFIPVINNGEESFASISPGRALALAQRFGLIVKTDYGKFVAGRVHI